MTDLPTRLRNYYRDHLHSNPYVLLVEEPHEVNLLNEAACKIEELEKKALKSDAFEYAINNIDFAQLSKRTKEITKAVIRLVIKIMNERIEAVNNEIE